VSPRITVTITVSQTGRMTIDAHGPVKGATGLLALLEAARDMAAQGADGQAGQ
jgi:hypothetical protein